MDEKQLKEAAILYESWSVEELVRATTVEKQDYEPEAINLMVRELSRRGVNAMSKNKAEWAAKLKGCNFELAGKEISDMLHSLQQEAKQKGGSYYLKNELENVLRTFISRPCLDTAINLLEVSPALYSYFEACLPGELFSYYTRILDKNKDGV